LNIPSTSDWHSEPLCLDGEWAYERFSGLNESQAFDLFAENALSHSEALLFMPIPCFRFYIRSYMRYLQSPESQGDSDGANAFFGVVEGRWQDVPPDDPSFRGELAAVLRRLASKQAWYDAEARIYGAFSERAHRCCKLLGIEVGYS
jgi:hypothetical protein